MQGLGAGDKAAFLRSECGFQSIAIRGKRAELWYGHGSATRTYSGQDNLADALTHWFCAVNNVVVWAPLKLAINPGHVFLSGV
mmetsp:Transcript_67829/g.181411  ORF Transcript_67829/g.181411 Transcript_67829/m.181411 type:complete len:83 (-) Transcript_67829:439-687(-)